MMGRLRRAWRRPLGAIAIFVVLAGLGAFAFVFAGLVPIAASSGHFAVTTWLLHSAMRWSVRTQAANVQIPEDLDLADPTLVLRGAGHYESSCAPCHGAPGRPKSVVARRMTPEPPNLVHDMGEWEDRELFWIVRHGVKYSAMPAWPAPEREDEVWSMVAFLRQVEEMSPSAYGRLAGTGAQAGGAGRLRGIGQRISPVVETSCARCHGADGLGRGLGAFPKLAGQNEVYLRASLAAYAAGERHSGFMEPVAAGLSQEQIARLAAHYAGLPGGPAERTDGDLALGGRIAAEGIAKSGVPACSRCHGPKEGPRAEIYPELAGQYPAYIELQLEAFREGHRGGTAYAHIMRTVAERLTDEEIRAVAAWYGSLVPD